MMRALCVVPLLLIALSRATAQDPSELLSTRPEKTEAPDVVESGTFQIESSAFAQRASGGVDCAQTGTARATSSTLSVGAWLLRLGVTDGLEVRFEGSTSHERVAVEACAERPRVDASVRELAAPTVGAKMRVISAHDMIPDVSIAAAVAINTGSGTLTDVLTPSLRLGIAKSITDDLALVANVAASWDGTSLAPATAYTLSTTVTINETFGAYVGAFGDLHVENDAAHSVDAGVSAAFTEAISAELFGAIGLTRTAADYYIGLGASLAIE
jgi:hypothetical protein